MNSHINVWWIPLRTSSLGIVHLLLWGFYGRNWTFNLRRLWHFCPNEQSDLEESQKSCPNFLLFSQENCPKIADFCPTKGATAPYQPLSYAYAMGGLSLYFIGCNLKQGKKGGLEIFSSLQAKLSFHPH